MKFIANAVGAIMFGFFAGCGFWLSTYLFTSLVTMLWRH